MKNMTKISTLFVALAFAATMASSVAADKKDPKPYTLKTCIVSDEKLGGMGETFTFVHNGQEIKLCCKSCQKDFNKSPEKFLKKLAAAQAKAKKS